ncbi:alkaline phosphatase [Brevibacterium sp. 5221]|uniref:Alkaline phosphatase n=2 Tax=Brevibacterium rongguiense TaxID=2695267 RepID=A0A6N9H700_9MICO|nr:alkaline phosphatase [Brevibacterium rongguiense]
MLDVLATAAADVSPALDVQASGLLDPTPILEGAGPWMLAVVALIVFIESGVLFPFLPGDSLLFVGGMLAPAMGVNLFLFIVVVWAAAILGDQVGYFLGRRFGRRFFKDDAKILNTTRLHAAEQFFAKHGGPSLVLARFVPFVRTFTPLAAGIAAYPYRRFIGWNVSGALLWGTLLSVAGYFLGSIDIIREHVDLWAIVLVGLSVIPMVIAWLKSRGTKRREVVEPTAPEAGETPADTPR